MTTARSVRRSALSSERQPRSQQSGLVDPWFTQTARPQILTLGLENVVAPR